jgi:flagellar biosynthesis protein FliQ
VDAEIVRIAADTIWLSTKLAAPILLVSLAIGVSISLVQTVFQVQEATLTFVPKLAGIALVLVLGGDWMIHELTAFTSHLYDMIPTLLDA